MVGLSQTATAAEGEELWRFDAGAAIESSPTVVNNTVFFGDASGRRDARLYALNAASGDEQWSLETRRAVETAPNVVDGTVYVGSGTINETSEGEDVYAVDAATGEVE